jgi:hypothetical protein
MKNISEDTNKKRNLLERVGDLIILETEKEICPKNETCYCVFDLIQSGSFSHNKASEYIQLICQSYPCACRLKSSKE